MKAVFQVGVPVSTPASDLTVNTVVSWDLVLAVLNVFEVDVSGHAEKKSAWCPCSICRLYKASEAVRMRLK